MPITLFDTALMRLQAQHVFHPTRSGAVYAGPWQPGSLMLRTGQTGDRHAISIAASLGIEAVIDKHGACVF
ncbi:MAG: hypothetical protein HRT77_16490 [Halioglobus sp.]|nr:hypothetical protein [Halioglobus sp.]